MVLSEMTVPATRGRKYRSTATSLGADCSSECTFRRARDYMSVLHVCDSPVFPLQLILDR